MKQKEIELFRTEDGFYAARELKGGSLSADKHKISGEEIMTMFTEFFVDYCRETGENNLKMQDAEGRIFITMMAGQPAKQPAPKPAPNKKQDGVLNKKPPKAANRKPRKTK